MLKNLLNRHFAQTSKALRPRIVAILLMLALVLIPLTAGAQLGLDPCCAALLAGLNTISGLLHGSVASPLSTITQIQQGQTAFERDVLYPMNSINQARGLAGQLLNELRQSRALYQAPTNSATLPGPQSLEAVILSHRSQSIPGVGQLYVKVYGKVMAPGDAPQNVRDQVDMSDAEAQDALKKAMQLDALADLELAAADQINQQLQTAAPGGAPILEAHAAAWIVRANAYTQSAYAELVRIKAIQLANTSGTIKQSASDTAGLSGTASQLLQKGTN